MIVRRADDVDRERCVIGRGGESRHFYWDDNPSRRIRSETLTGKQALDQARTLARAERDRTTLGNPV
jgi:hypothetical protein